VKEELKDRDGRAGYFPGSFRRRRQRGGVRKASVVVDIADDF
jgi:hypothetical protein